MTSGRKKTRIAIDGKALGACLKRKGLSQKEIALKLSLSRETINRAIKHNELDPLVLDDICKEINVSPRYITGQERIKRGDLVGRFVANSKNPELIEATIPPADENGYIIFPYYEFDRPNANSSEAFKAWVSAAAKADIGYFQNVPGAREELVGGIEKLDETQLQILQDKIVTSVVGYIRDGKLDYPNILFLMQEGEQ